MDQAQGFCGALTWLCSTAGGRVLACLLAFASSARGDGERLNHEGRLLGPPPSFSTPLLFNTPEADAVVAAMQILPPDNPWNEDVSRLPVLSNSDAMIARIMSELSSSRRTLRVFHEMNFVLVPDTQPLVPIAFLDYPEESDDGPYPIPPVLPIETWPRETGTLSLQDWQVDVNDDGGDRHAIMVQPGAGTAFETWQTRLVGGNWEASNGAKFDLNSNALRPAGWTSGDAAGLAMFPALVRYDECQRGRVEHAVRLVVKHTRNEYLYPARHRASVPVTTDVNVPAMGQRLRLKSTFVIPADWTLEEQAVLRGLKKYGAIVADNGNFFSISATPDHRYPPGAFDHLSSISITNFEVVQQTGMTGGPRSPGAPVAHAGADRQVALGAPVVLEGAAAAAGPVTCLWSLGSGPAGVAIENPGASNTLANVTAPGTYVFVLGVSDGVHAVAYDAVRIDVVEGLRLSATLTNGAVEVTWVGGVAPYALQVTPVLPAIRWQTILSTNVTRVLVDPAGAGFLRVLGSAGP